MEQMTFLDFFAGIGGFRKGFELCGMRCVGHCEIDKYADRSYRAIHDVKEDEWYAADITKVAPADLPRADLWAGGFPCQDISVAGRQRGLDGARSGLFFTLAQLVKGQSPENRPTWIVLENVKNLLSIHGGWDFATVLDTLASLGYHIEYGLLNTDEGNGMSDMALHMKTLEIEFSLYLPSLTDMQKAILKQTIIELYNQFGIFWETDIRQLKATDFPILSDLHALLEKKAEANKENPVYRDLAMLLYDAAAGSDSFLWNGHTTLEANSRFICLDTHDLQNASDNVKRTQYLNLLSWCWEEMSRDRNERCLLVCDEAYLMIDPQVPQSLVFLRNVEKRARKYEAGLAIISHSVVDFLAPEVKMYGQALLDIPCYKILMGCDGKNLQETKDLYNLTDAEQELLESKRRGHALFIIGSKRLHVNFEIPAYKFSYMGKAGGR